MALKGRNYIYYIDGTLREKFRLRVFENRVLRRIFGPKREENIRMHFEEIGIDEMNWMELVQHIDH